MNSQINSKYHPWNQKGDGWRKNRFDLEAARGGHLKRNKESGVVEDSVSTGRSQENSNLNMEISTILIVGLLYLNSCTPLETLPPSPGSRSTPVGVVTAETVQVYQATSTSTPEVVATATVGPVEWAGGGQLSPEFQNELQQTEWIKKLDQQWRAFIYYWSHAKTPLFNPNSQPRLVIIPNPYNIPKDKYDHVEDKVIVMLEWTDLNGNLHTSFMPRNTINPAETGSVFQTTPPNIIGKEGKYEISDWAGTAPMDITDGESGLKWVWDNGDFYRVDTNDHARKKQFINQMGMWEIFDPGKHLKEIVNVIQVENHSYVFPESGVAINYSLETDITKQEYKVGMNYRFPNAEATMAKVLSESIWNSMGGTQYMPYDVFMKQGMPGKMKFKAYWEGEKEARVGEMAVPTKPIRFVFVDQYQPNNFDLQVNDNLPNNPNYVSIYVNNGELIILVGNTTPKSKNMRPYGADDETWVLGASLSTLFDSDSTAFYYKLATSRDSNATKILKVTP